MAQSISSEAAVSSDRSPNLHTNYQLSQCPKFIYLPELSSEKIGGKVLYSTDNQDDGTKNLLKASDPVWNDSVLNKQLDGWETVSTISQNCQWCIIQLGIPGIVYGVDVDTAYFIGHHALQMSIQGASLNTKRKSKSSNENGGFSSSKDWEELVPLQPLQPGYQTCCHNYFKVSNRNSWTHIRFSIFPGGGVARLRIYGHPIADSSLICNDSLTDLLLLQNGGLCVCSSCPEMIRLASNINYDNQEREISNTWMRPEDNRLLPVLDLENLKDTEMQVFWAVYRLGHAGIVKKIKIETGKFDCKYPSFCQLEACTVNHKPNMDDNGFEEEVNTYPWYTLLPLTGLLPCTQLYFEITPPRHGGVVTHIRLSVGLAVPTPVKHMLLQSTLKRLYIWGYNCIPSFPKL